MSQTYHSPVHLYHPYTGHWCLRLTIVLLSVPFLHWALMSLTYHNPGICIIPTQGIDVSDLPQSCYLYHPYAGHWCLWLTTILFICTIPTLGIDVSDLPQSCSSVPSLHWTLPSQTCVCKMYSPLEQVNRFCCMSSAGTPTTVDSTNIANAEEFMFPEPDRI